MRRILLLSCALLAFVVPLAHAAPGVNMRWTSCYGDGGAFNRNFACNTNTGSNVLVGSFVLGQAVEQMSGSEMILDLASASSPLPNWWAFRNAGTCRQNSLLTSTPEGTVACVNWAGFNEIVVGASYTIGFNGPATARFVLASGVAQPYPSVVANVEYLSFKVTINNQKTVGTGTCAGCSVPVCLRFASIKVVGPPPATDVFLSGPTNGTDSDFVTWQNGAAACLAATPARRETWGAVKSLYR